MDGRNNAIFDSFDVVTSYQAMPGLFPAEEWLFSSYVPHDARVLDLGVGTGRTTPWLAAIASSYLGIDIAPLMVERARQVNPTERFIVGDATDLSMLDDASFDVVVFSYNGLDYVVPGDDRDRCLREIARVLAPGGTFIFSSHDPRAVIRPRNPDLGLRAWPVAWFQTLRRAGRRVRERAFWLGEGMVLDPVRGGLLTYMITPRRVEADLASYGFRQVNTSTSLHPRPPRLFGNEWWYYVFVREAPPAEP